MKLYLNFESIFLLITLRLHVLNQNIKKGRNILQLLPSAYSWNCWWSYSNIIFFVSEEICKGCYCGRWSYVVSCCTVNVNSGSRLACPALMWLPAFPRHQACSVLLRAREGVSLSLLTGCGHELHSVVLHLICWPLARSRSHPSFEMSRLHVTYLQSVVR